MSINSKEMVSVIMNVNNYTNEQVNSLSEEVSNKIKDSMTQMNLLQQIIVININMTI